MNNPERAALPQRLEFSPRMIYLFVYAMTTWILNVLLSGKAAALLQGGHGTSWPVIVLLTVGFGLAGGAVGVALRSLREVA